MSRIFKDVLINLIIILFGLILGGVVGLICWWITGQHIKLDCCQDLKYGVENYRCNVIPDIQVGDGKDCFVWYYPIPEVLIGAFVGGILAFIYTIITSLKKDK